jgi:hypothetical protein
LISKGDNGKSYPSFNRGERSSLNKEFTFCYDPLPDMAPQAILVSDWSISKNLLL